MAQPHPAFQQLARDYAAGAKHYGGEIADRISGLLARQYKIVSNTDYRGLFPPDTKFEVSEFILGLKDKYPTAVFVCPSETLVDGFKEQGALYFVVTFTTNGTPTFDVRMLMAEDGVRYSLSCAQFKVEYTGDGLSVQQNKENMFEQMGIDGESFCKEIYRRVMSTFAIVEAGLAITEEVTFGKFINNKRLKKGKSALEDYRIVYLNKPKVDAAPKVDGSTHAAPRLHFRRGHWRQLETKQVWVRWCLVGDENKGIVDKEYRV